MLTLARLAGMTTANAHRLRLQLESDLTKRAPQAGADAASKAGAMGSLLTRLAEAEVPKDKHPSAQAATGLSKLLLTNLSCDELMSLV